MAKHYPLGGPIIEVIKSHEPGRDFCITYIAMFLDELIKEGIITGMQSAQAKKYILKCQRLSPYNKKE